MIRRYSNVVLVRKAKNKDVRSIHGFISELKGQKLDYEKFKEAYHTNLDNPEMIYLVAEQGTDIVGFVCCVSHLRLSEGGDRIGEIKEMFVLPYMRSMGIEHLLLEKLSVVSKTKGIARVDVSLELDPDANKNESDSDRLAGE